MCVCVCVRACVRILRAYLAGVVCVFVLHAMPVPAVMRRMEGTTRQTQTQTQTRSDTQTQTLDYKTVTKAVGGEITIFLQKPSALCSPPASSKGSLCQREFIRIILHNDELFLFLSAAYIHYVYTEADAADDDILQSSSQALSQHRRPNAMAGTKSQKSVP